MNIYSIETITVGQLETNCYLFTETSTKKTLIIDPGAEADVIKEVIAKKKLIPAAIVNTHGHADHIISNNELKIAFNVPLYIHAEDAVYLTDPSYNGSYLIGAQFASPDADKLLKEGDVISLGDLKLKVIHTPGHTPGGICLWCENVLFTGDTLFCGSIGRWDFKGGSQQTLLTSLNKFAALPRQTIIYPGHGPSCTLEGEYKHNPYLR